MGWWDRLLGRGKKMADEAVDKARDVMDRDKEPAPASTEGTSAGAGTAPPPAAPGPTGGGAGTTPPGSAGQAGTESGGTSSSGGGGGAA
jgi:hypothetical protein